MEKLQKFNPNSVEILQDLLQTNPKDFISNLAKKFYINATLFRLYYQTMGIKSTISFLKQATLDEENFFDEAVAIYDGVFISQILVEAHKTNFLVERNKISFLVQKGLYLDEICQEFIRQKKINKEFYQEENLRLILEKNQDWLTFAYFDDVQILSKHNQIKMMLRGGEKCFEYLCQHDMEDELFAFAKQHNIQKILRFFLEKCKNYFLFSKGNNWRLIYNLYQGSSFWTIVDTKSIQCLALSYVAFFKEEEKEEDNPELYQAIFTCFKDLSDMRRNVFSLFNDNKKAAMIWFYGKAQKHNVELVCQFTIFDRIYWQLKRKAYYDMSFFQLCCKIS